MDELLKTLNRYPNGQILTIEMRSGERLKCRIDTIYETNNEFEPDDERYIEYYACAVQIDTVENTINDAENLLVGSLIEISMLNQPKCISFEDGTVIWNQEQ